jgi:hypothetical protein
MLAGGERLNADLRVRVWKSRDVESIDPRGKQLPE